MNALLIVLAVLGTLGALLPLMIWGIKRTVRQRELLEQLPAGMKETLCPAWLGIADRVLFLVFVLLLLPSPDSDAGWIKWGLFVSVAALAILHGAFVFRILCLVRKSGEREPLGLMDAARNEMISHSLTAAVYLLFAIVLGPLRGFWT